MRAAFFGTPPIAVPALQALTEVAEVVGVVCQPDRPAGRGLKLQEPAVKTAARQLGLEVHQPVKVKTGKLHTWLAEREVDLALVMAYGRILPPAVLAAPRHGCLNLHASLLPRYRGAAPINWALMHGERQTGISLMQMDEGLDTGPVYATRSLEIGEEETAGELSERLALLAADVTRFDLPRALAGELELVKQDEARASYAPPLTAQDLVLNWEAPAIEIVNRIRALAPKPGARTQLNGRLLKLSKAKVVEAPGADRPGRLSVDGKRVIVQSGEGGVELLFAQLEGKREQPAALLVNGRQLKSGDLLGASE